MIVADDDTDAVDSGMGFPEKFELTGDIIILAYGSFCHCVLFFTGQRKCPNDSSIYYPSRSLSESAPKQQIAYIKRVIMRCRDRQNVSHGMTSTC